MTRGRPCEIPLERVVFFLEAESRKRPVPMNFLTLWDRSLVNVGCREDLKLPQNYGYKHLSIQRGGRSIAPILISREES